MQKNLLGVSGLTRLDFRYTNGSVYQLSQEGTGESIYSVLCSSVDTTTRICFAASNRTKIDNVSRFLVFELCQTDI